MNSVLQKTKLRKLMFTPSLLLQGGSLQTIATVFMHKRILKKGLANYEREIFKLQDGGTIALDWAE